MRLLAWKLRWPWTEESPWLLRADAETEAGPQRKVGSCLKVGRQAAASKRVENTEQPTVSFLSLELQLTTDHS